MRKDASDIKHEWCKHSRNDSGGKAKANRRIRQALRRQLNKSIENMTQSDYRSKDRS